MKELFRTTNPVLLSHALAVLEEAGVMAFELDRHMSVLEGSIGILPRRVMVADRDLFMAQAVIRDAGLADE